MQRKGGILMQFNKQRDAFSMVTAIFVIVLMASVAAFIMNLSGKMVQETTAQYQREQSVLLAKSYTEYAIMAVTANEQNLSTCLNNISGSYGSDGAGNPLYNIDVNISYFGNGRTPANGGLNSNCSKILYNPTSTEHNISLSIMVDVFVHYTTIDHPDGTSAPKVTYHKRSLQKI